MRNLKILTMMTAIALSAMVTPQAEAQLLNPCCRPVRVCCRPVVPVCCGPVIVRRPIIRNSAAELRMALHYHLNYRYYRGAVYSDYVIVDDVSDATPTKANPHATEKPYHEESAGQGDSVLQPVQPQGSEGSEDSDPADLQDPADPAEDPADPADPDADEDSFQIEQPTTTTLKLTVAENAIVKINGKVTSSTGTSRTFISRNLDATARYRYQVEVSWNVGTSQYKVTETIDMVSGRSVAKSFTTPFNPAIVQK